MLAKANRNYFPRPVRLVGFLPQNLTYEFPELLGRPYGEPVDGQQCRETAPRSGVFTREWSGATVSMDCNNWSPTITMQDTPAT